MRQRKRKKRQERLKRMLASLVAIFLVMGMGTLGTLAYLSTLSEKKQNTFTATKNISLTLEEPNYNEYTDNNKTTLRYPDAPNPDKFQPGEIYTKDPTLYNTTGMATDGELAEEWVAIRVDYKIGGNIVTRTELESKLIETIPFDTTNWIKAGTALGLDGTEKYEIYIYKYKLKAQDKLVEGKTYSELKADTIIASVGANVGAKTTPLFSQIQIKAQSALVATYTSMENVPGFDIDIIGGAIKDQDDNLEDAIDSAKWNDTSTYSYKVSKALVDLLKNAT